MMTPVRVYYRGQPPHEAPWTFPCGLDMYFNSEMKHCLYPGLQVEIVNAIFRNLQRPIIAIDVGNATYETISATFTCDVFARLLPVEVLQALNYSTTYPIFFESMAAITTNRPVSEKSDFFAFTSPFTPTVWLVMLLLIALRKTYTTFLNMNSVIVDQIQYFRPTFASSLVPITLMLMILVNLYQGRLLTDMLLRKAIYSVNTIDDIASLPDRVQLVSEPDTWVRLLQSSDDTLRRKLVHKDRTLASVDADTLFADIQNDRAVYLAAHTEVKYLLNAHRQFDVRVVSLGSAARVAIGVSRSCDPRILTELNQTIIKLQHLIDGIREWYMRYRPRSDQTETNRAHVDATEEYVAVGIDAVRGCFGLLLVGLLAGAVVTLAEMIVVWLGGQWRGH